MRQTVEQYTCSREFRRRTVLFVDQPQLQRNTVSRPEPSQIAPEWAGDAPRDLSLCGTCAFIATRVQERRDCEPGSGQNDLAYLELGRNSGIKPASISYGPPKVGTDQRVRGFGATAGNADGSTPPEGQNTLLREALRHSGARFVPQSDIARLRQSVRI